MKAKNWLNELYKSGSNTMTIFLIGNKQDLPDRVVDTEVRFNFTNYNSLFYY